MRTKECVLTRAAKGYGRGLLYNYEVRDENGDLICNGGPVSKSLAKHNATTLGAKIVERFSAPEAS